MSEENNSVLIDGTEVSLADLAGIDISEVKAVRFSVTPAGKFIWRICATGLISKEVVENYDDPNSAKISVPCIEVELKAVNCIALVDDEADPADFVDISHRKLFKIAKWKEGMGRVVAFMEDIGIDPAGKTITSLLDEAHGVEFVCDVTNTKDRNNPDIVYANLNNIITLEEFEEQNSEETSE